MTVRVPLVRSVCVAHGLDHLQVYDQAKRSLIYEARGAADVLTALDELPEMLSGTFRLLGTQQGAKGKEAPAFEWVVMFDGDNGGEASTGRVGGVDGPSWREMMELREEMLEMRLRAELQPVGGGPWDKIAEMLPDLLPGIVGKVTRAPVAAAAPVVEAAPIAAAAPGELPPDVLNAAANIAKLYRMDPATFAQYAPVLDQMVNGSGNGKA
jgi:hypothetical protein